MSSYNAYTGTFTTKGGQTRTMTFIRTGDMPSSAFSGKKTTSEGKQGQEVVFDVGAKGFRTFNWNTTKGSVSREIIQFSFDKSE